uniref:Tudor domain containing 6 n=1 Tax=Cyclopterus lumpus TaxID=8103 RepID=A0A8C2WK66_CYCLU
MSLQSHSAVEESPETRISMAAGERLHKNELFMYPELSAGTVETVIVTEVTNPQRMFCQLKVFSQELKKLSGQITQCCEGRTINCIVSPEMIGFPCAAKGSDGRWYRSVLQQVCSNNKVVEVLNVDYGTKQFVQIGNVRPLASEFFRMPVVTYICSFHGIIDKGVGWTTSEIDYLKTLLLHKTVIAKFEYQSISEGVHYVTLYGDDNTSINNLFGSRESCFLESEKTLGDYAICNTASSCKQPAQQERNPRKMLTHAQTVEGTERKDIVRLPTEHLALNSSHVAAVQHISDPSEFWIQTQTYANKFDELMDSIYHLYKVSLNNDVVRNPTVGIYCAAKAGDGEFYRATVAEASETQVKVFFVDYGNTEVVDKSNIRTLPDEFKKLPCLSLKCSLAGVRPKDGKWSLSAQDLFIKAVKDKDLTVHVTTQGQLKTKMTMLSGVYSNKGMSFQTTVNTVGTVGKEKQIPTFKEHMFPIGSVIDVSVSYIESPNDFWCQQVKNTGHLKLLMHDIQAQYAGSEFQPNVEMACIARHPDNQLWYRALVIYKREMPHVDVLFVDYGQTETVSLYDLRRISPQFLALQGQAFRCSLLNPVDPTSAVNEWNREAIETFHSFVETAASSSFVILKCTIYAVMYSEQKIVFNIVDLETPFESVCTSMVNLVKSAPPKIAAGPSFRLDTYYYSMHNVKTGTEEQVTVTCVNNVHEFYCHLEKNADVIKDLKIKVKNLCHQLRNVKLPTVFGTLCFAKYTNGHWYRGQIKATKPAILVHFVDYGDTIEVEKSDLLPIPREASDIMSVPVQAVQCSLSDVPANVPTEMNHWFETSAIDCKFQALVVAREPDGKLQVELYHGNTQVNSKIKKMFQTEKHTEENVKSPLNFSLCYHQEEFLEGQKLEVYITAISDAQTFWCQPADSEDLEKITSSVSKVLDANSADHMHIDPDSISLGSPCIALFSDDGFWYRAEVIDRDEDALSVLFVDYGNKSQVNFTDVREMPPDLTQTPRQAFLCELEGFDASHGSWHSNAVDELSVLTTDKVLQLTVTRVASEAGKIKCLVQIECEGQVINEALKTWWRSASAENQPGAFELSPPCLTQLQCEEQSTGELVDPHADILPCDGGMDEIRLPQLHNKGAEGILTLSCVKSAVETDKGVKEEKAFLVMDIIGPDDFNSLLDENSTEAMDESESPTYSMESSFDIINSSGKHIHFYLLFLISKQYDAFLLIK